MWFGENQSRDSQDINEQLILFIIILVYILVYKNENIFVFLNITRCSLRLVISEILLFYLVVSFTESAFSIPDFVVTITQAHGIVMLQAQENRYT